MFNLKDYAILDRYPVGAKNWNNLTVISRLQYKKMKEFVKEANKCM